MDAQNVRCVWCYFRDGSGLGEAHQKSWTPQSNCSEWEEGTACQWYIISRVMLKLGHGSFAFCLCNILYDEYSTLTILVLNGKLWKQFAFQSNVADLAFSSNLLDIRSAAYLFALRIGPTLMRSNPSHSVNYALFGPSLRY